MCVPFLARTEFADDMPIDTFALKDVLIRAQPFESNGASSMDSSRSDSDLSPLDK
jgi:hypothetical protein